MVVNKKQSWNTKGKQRNHYKWLRCNGWGGGRLDVGNKNKKHCINYELNLIDSIVIRKSTILRNLYANPKQSITA